MVNLTQENTMSRMQQPDFHVDAPMAFDDAEAPIDPWSLDEIEGASEIDSLHSDWLADASFD
jgi:hypothetical protein